MKNFKAAVDAFLNDESGASAVEYGLIVALIAAVVVVSVTTVGSNANKVFDDVAKKIVTPTAN
jgi:pilus assembly protein Flp/PilA